MPAYRSLPVDGIKLCNNTGIDLELISVLPEARNPRPSTKRRDYGLGRPLLKVTMHQTTMTITATCAVITVGQMRENAGSKYFCGPNDTKAVKANRIVSALPKRDL